MTSLPVASPSPPRPLDIQIGRLMARLDRGRCPELEQAAVLVSQAAGQGHTCLPLELLAEQLHAAAPMPAARASVASLATSLAASHLVGGPDSARPLILDQDRLYLLRLHRAETAIAADLRLRAAAMDRVDPKLVRPLLDQLFPPDKTKREDWQRAAAALALHKRFVLLSGGPGTGKTYTAARILSLFARLRPKQRRIALAAPTGKAALRLQESLARAQTHPEPDDLALPEQAYTLHRLLGYSPASSRFRHNAEHQLALDLLIVDEASMIDVPLMAALLAALAPDCRLLLLGDRDQLASVEAGNLFADLCGRAAVGWSPELTTALQPLLDFPLPPPVKAGPLADSLVVLRDSRRFAADSGIGALARAINTGSPETIDEALALQAPDLSIRTVEPGDYQQCLAPLLEDFFQPLKQAGSAREVLDQLERRRVLCALREGPSGVEGINRQAMALLYGVSGERPCPGMPLMVVRNDYAQGLFNGDTGVFWPDAKGQLVAWFPGEHSDLIPVHPARLPPWQTACAITVHKAQGSEFDKVLLVLPPKESQVLGRELLYTGITRARRHLTVFAPEALLRQAAARRQVRYTGLEQRLR
ncbi:MAG: exodeoxyribonuclease V subunit alpha [Desulfobulbus sp.]|jgi:exodeoxyribonuclease V alpha subunit